MNNTGNWQEAERHLRACDPVMAGLIDTHGSCRLVPDTDYFTGILDAIISQQLSLKAASTIFGRFRSLCADNMNPVSVSQLPVEALRSAGLSGAKAACVLDLCQHILDGRLRLHEMDGLPDEEVVSELTAVKGIGPWTAQMILMFHMNRPDVLPLADLGIREGFRRAYGLTDRPEAAWMEETARPWRPWRTVGSWYLWRKLEEPVVV